MVLLQVLLVFREQRVKGGYCPAARATCSPSVPSLSGSARCVVWYDKSVCSDGLKPEALLKMSELDRRRSTHDETHVLPAYPPPELIVKDTLCTREQYETLYRQSLDDPEAFWSSVAKDLYFNKPWEKPFMRYASPLATYLRRQTVDFERSVISLVNLLALEDPAVLY